MTLSCICTVRVAKRNSAMIHFLICGCAFHTVIRNVKISSVTKACPVNPSLSHSLNVVSVVAVIAAVGWKCWCQCTILDVFSGCG